MSPLTALCRTFALLLMMRDQFANYVVQKMLDVVDGEQRELLLSRMKPHLQSLRKFTYGKHILAKVERLLGYSLADPALPAATPTPTATALPLSPSTVLLPNGPPRVPSAGRRSGGAFVGADASPPRQ